MNKADVDAAAAVRAKTLLAENAVLLAEANSAQLKQEQKKLLRVRADDVVKKNVIRAMTLGLIPFPALDIVALTHAQFKMTDDLLGLYEIPHSRVGRSVLRSFIIGVLPVATITSVSSLFKVIPGVGSFVGSSGVSISSGGLTYTVGKILTQHFEQGGTFENFNVIEAKNQFKDEFSHNVKIVGKMKLNSPLKQGG